MSESYLNEAAQRVEDRIEIPMIIISVAVIPVLIVEYTTTSPTLAAAAWVANVIIWMAFVAEYTIMMVLVDNRWTYTKRAWLDVAIIILSPPVFVPEYMAGLRVLRSLRALRLFRVARVGRVARISRASRIMRLFAFAGRAYDGASRALKKNSMQYVLLVTVILVLAAGSLFYIVESGQTVDALSEGMWWAITTMTTVGYGDIAPTTLFGRLLAAGVMILGIGFASILTANIAAWFVEQDQKAPEDELREEVGRLREEITELKAMMQRQLSD